MLVIIKIGIFAWLYLLFSYLTKGSHGLAASCGAVQLLGEGNKKECPFELGMAMAGEENWSPDQELSWELRCPVRLATLSQSNPPSKL